MRDLLLQFCLASLLLIVCAGFKFVQVTDIHAEPAYTPGASTKHSAFCASGVGDAGLFGSHVCDVGDVLLDSVLRQTAKLAQDAAFVIYTGDVIPHQQVFKATDSPSKATVLEYHESLTRKFNEYLPDLLIIPGIGNHDAYPYGEHLCPDINWLYEGVSEMWSKWLSKEAKNDFALRASYSVDLERFIGSAGSNITLIVVNTNPFATTDRHLMPEDPCDIFSWLEGAISRRRKYIVLEHVPPGVFETVPAPLMWPEHQKRYLDILNNTGGEILAAIAGHEHTDSFRFDSLWPNHCHFLSPAVTPFGEFTFKGNNPSLRVYEYSEESGRLVDYQQYFLDLDKANSDGQAVWELEYSWRDAYQVPDMSYRSCVAARDLIVSDTSVLNAYMNRISVSYVFDHSAVSKRYAKCAMQHIRWESFYSCLL